jgi:uncharacterized protein YbjT (DUF2867 family)
MKIAVTGATGFIGKYVLKDEITAQLDYIKEWGGSFVLAIPELSVIDA